MFAIIPLPSAKAEKEHIADNATKGVDARKDQFEATFAIYHTDLGQVMASSQNLCSCIF